MKVIAIPANAKVRIPVKNAGGVLGWSVQEVSFTDFLTQSLSGYEMFKKGAANARVYDKIMNIVEKIGPEQAEVRFEDEDFKKVKDAVANSDWITPDINRAYISFYDAVDKATDEPNPNK